jgi:hypothetical protein
VSAGYGIWKQNVAQAEPAARPYEGLPDSDHSLADDSDPDQIVSLVRHLFMGSVPARKRVFFVGADHETNVSSICERAARALSDLRQSRIALVDATTSDSTPWPSVGTSVDAERSFQTALESPNRVWRIPSQVLLQTPARHDDGLIKFPFEYVLFAAAVSDSVAPVFSRESEGAVLVVTANRTRREAALHAKQVLSQWNAEVLGVVLDQRTFPVPEAIYRRL